MAIDIKDSQPTNFERSVLRVTESANYCCQYCGSGAETFEKAFPNGCAKCGGPAGKYDKETVMREFPDLQKRFFVVNAPDTNQETARFIQILKNHNGSVVTLEDLLPNGIETHEVSKVLEEATARAGWVVFVPSPQLNRGPADGIVLDMVMDDMIRKGTRKTFPLFVDQVHTRYAPPMLAGIWGVVMNKEGADNATGLENFERRLPEMIDKLNNS